MKNVKKYRILSIEAERLAHAEAVGGFSVLTDGKHNLRLFSGIFDYSLESEKIREVCERTKKMSRRTYFSKNGYDYTTAVVNVKFTSNRHDFVSIGGAYVLEGFERSEDFFNAAETREIDGEELLVAIKTHKPLEAPPLPDNILGEYFAYDPENNYYVRRRDENDKIIPFKDEENRRELRERLYDKGFNLDGVHYVRYKRSAGSSRTGQCLFIAEPIYKKMMEWSLCGLDLKNISFIDLASFEAYVSLSLSSITDTVRIPLDSILFMKDARSRFITRAVSVECDENGILSSAEKEVEISNVIWDGEALLDASVFADAGYGNKGMMLLRNRFFKTCAFNTNLQEYFADNQITEVSQLCGYTRAKRVEDIKLIVTESSLKYLKLSGEKTFEAKVDAWLRGVEDLFGIVKTDKPTGYFGGRVTRTSYQLLNTLGLSENETRELLRDTLDYYEKIRSSPMYMRNFINYTLGEAEEEDEESGFFNARQKAILYCLSKNDLFSETVAYSDFRSTVLSSFSKKIRSGKLLVKGTNAIIFGNGLELLSAAVGNFREGDEALALGGEGKIYCKRFEGGASLLGCRSPHVTMGNLAVAENCPVPEIDRYFNLTSEIVYVNAIKCNIQQRLNGCDYDSDAMLLTDDPIIVAAAKRNAGFAVPVCSISSTRKEYADTFEGKAALDYEISGNKIGEIINLSQLLNTLYWHNTVNHPDEIEKNGELYRDICVLAVLSGMEIDKAKRNYNVATASVLRRLKAKYSMERTPEFFKFIMYTLVRKRRFTGETFSYDTTMDYVFSLTKSFTSAMSKSRYEKRGLSDFVRCAEDGGAKIKSESNDARDCEYIKRYTRDCGMRIGELRNGMKYLEEDDKLFRREEIELIYRNATDYVGKKLKNGYMLKSLLQDIDENLTGADGDDKKFWWILFETLCFERGGRFLDLLSSTREEDMYDLVPDDAGDIEIYGVNHVKRKARG